MPCHLRPCSSIVSNCSIRNFFLSFLRCLQNGFSISPASCMYRFFVFIENERLSDRLNPTQQPCQTAMHAFGCNNVAARMSSRTRPICVFARSRPGANKPRILTSMMIIIITIICMDREQKHLPKLPGHSRTTSTLGPASEGVRRWNYRFAHVLLHLNHVHLLPVIKFEWYSIALSVCKWLCAASNYLQQSVS